MTDLFSDCTSVQIVTVDARSENDNRQDTTNLGKYRFGWIGQKYTENIVNTKQG